MNEDKNPLLQFLRIHWGSLHSQRCNCEQFKQIAGLLNYSITSPTIIIGKDPSYHRGGKGLKNDMVGRQAKDSLKQGSNCRISQTLYRDPG